MAKYMEKDMETTVIGVGILGITNHGLGRVGDLIK